jgi:hypothetical protein
MESDVIYTKEHINFLNEKGYLGTAHLRLFFKVSFVGAMNILKKILGDFENVHSHGKHAIYIHGRKPEAWITPEKKKKVRMKKPKRWKDIKKP